MSRRGLLSAVASAVAGGTFMLLVAVTIAGVIGL